MLASENTHLDSKFHRYLNSLTRLKVILKDTKEYAEELKKIEFCLDFYHGWLKSVHNLTDPFAKYAILSIWRKVMSPKEKLSEAITTGAKFMLLDYKR